MWLSPLEHSQLFLLIEIRISVLVIISVSETVMRFVTHCRFYQTLVLWLDEPRLHDPSLYLPSLPPPYDPARLETLLKPELVWSVQMLAFFFRFFNIFLNVSDLYCLVIQELVGTQSKIKIISRT